MLQLELVGIKNGGWYAAVLTGDSGVITAITDSGIGNSDYGCQSIGSMLRNGNWRS